MIIFIQIAKWFWALFPALIGIISPTGAYNKQNNLDLQQSQLISNSDLLIDSDNNGVPDGFNYENATDISLTNGIATFTATKEFGRLALNYSTYSTFSQTDTYYTFASIKSDSNKVGLSVPPNRKSHTGSNNFEFLSGISVYVNRALIAQVADSRTENFTPISVDYVGAINLTAVFGNNIPDKQVLDDFILSGERFLFTDDNTTDSWFNTGFTGESRDILDILGYFFWLAIPIIGIYWVFRLLLQII